MVSLVGGVGHVWGTLQELLHPRGRDGRFIKKNKMAPDIAEALDKQLTAFRPRTFPSDQAASQWLSNVAKPGRFGGGTDIARFKADFEAVQEDLRDGVINNPSTRKYIQMMDNASIPLPDDAILSRTVSPAAFGLTPQNVDDPEHGIWGQVGNLVADRGYSSTNLGHPIQGPPGSITIVHAVPKGTKVIIPGNSPNDREVVLDREQQMRISKVTPDGRGGYVVYAAITPHTGQATPPPKGGHVGVGTTGNREARIQALSDAMNERMKATGDTKRAAETKLNAEEVARNPQPPGPGEQPMHAAPIQQAPLGEHPNSRQPSPTGPAAANVPARQEPMVSESVGTNSPATPAAPSAPAATPPASAPGPAAPPVPAHQAGAESFRATARHLQAPSGQGPQRKQWNNAYDGITQGKKHPDDVLRELEADIGANKQNLDTRQAELDAKKAKLNPDEPSHEKALAQANREQAAINVEKENNDRLQKLADTTKSHFGLEGRQAAPEAKPARAPRARKAAAPAAPKEKAPPTGPAELHNKPVEATAAEQRAKEDAVIRRAKSLPETPRNEEEARIKQQAADIMAKRTGKPAEAVKAPEESAAVTARKAAKAAKRAAAAEPTPGLKPGGVREQAVAGRKPTLDEIRGMTVAELRNTAKAHNVAGTSGMRKEQLQNHLIQHLHTGVPAAGAVPEAPRARTKLGDLSLAEQKRYTELRKQGVSEQEALNKARQEGVERAASGAPTREARQATAQAHVDALSKMETREEADKHLAGVRGQALDDLARHYSVPSGKTAAEKRSMIREAAVDNRIEQKALTPKGVESVGATKGEARKVELPPETVKRGPRVPKAEQAPRAPRVVKERVATGHLDEHIKNLEGFKTRAEADAYLSKVRGAQLDELARHVEAPSRLTAAEKRNWIGDATTQKVLDAEAFRGMITNMGSEADTRARRLGATTDLQHMSGFVGNNASEKAWGNLINGLERHGITTTAREQLHEAVRTGDNAKIHEAIDAAAKEGGIKRITGWPGTIEPFDPTRHAGIGEGSEKLQAGDPVQIDRPGFDAGYGNTHKALVSAPAAPEIPPSGPGKKGLQDLENASLLKDLRNIAAENNIQIPSKIRTKQAIHDFLKERLGAQPGETKAEHANRLGELKPGELNGPLVHATLTPERKGDFLKGWSKAAGAAPTGGPGPGRSAFKANNEIRDDLASGKITPAEALRRMENEIGFHQDDLAEAQREIRSGTLQGEELATARQRAGELRQAIANQTKLSKFLREHFNNEAPISTPQLEKALPKPAAHALEEATPQQIRDLAKQAGLPDPGEGAKDEVMKIVTKSLADAALGISKPNPAPIPEPPHEPGAPHVDEVAKGLDIPELTRNLVQMHLNDPKMSMPAIGRRVRSSANGPGSPAWKKAVAEAVMPQNKRTPEWRAQMDKLGKQQHDLLQLADRLEKMKRSRVTPSAAPAPTELKPAEVKRAAKIAEQTGIPEAQIRSGLEKTKEANAPASDQAKGIVDMLNAAKSTAEANGILKGKTAAELRDIAKAAGVEHAPRANKTDLAGAITRQTVTRRLEHGAYLRRATPAQLEMPAAGPGGVPISEVKATPGTPFEVLARGVPLSERQPGAASSLADIRKMLDVGGKRLAELPTREEALKQMETVRNREDLLQLAGEHSIPGAKSMSMKRLREELVNSTVSARRNSIATRGFEGEMPKTPIANVLATGKSGFEGESSKPLPAHPRITFSNGSNGGTEGLIQRLGRTNGDEPLRPPNGGSDQGVIHMDSHIGELWQSMAADPRAQNSELNKVAEIGTKLGRGQMTVPEARDELVRLEGAVSDPQVKKRIAQAGDALTAPHDRPDLPDGVPTELKHWLDTMSQVPDMRTTGAHSRIHDEGHLNESRYDRALALVKKAYNGEPVDEQELRRLGDVHESIDGGYTMQRVQNKLFAGMPLSLRRFLRGQGGGSTPGEPTVVKTAEEAPMANHETVMRRLGNMTIPELRQEAKNRGIPNADNMGRNDLVDALAEKLIK